jgi:HK97 gp10 family phage protein
MEATIEVSTLGLEKKLDAMELTARTSLLGRAINTVAKSFKAGLKAATPVGPTGNLQKSITHKTARYSGSGIAIGFIGPNWWNKGRHGHLVEAGTKARFNKAGASRGIMPAAPFLQPWFDQNKAAMESQLAAELSLQIEKEWGAE